MASRNMQSKNVVITGAGSGIGRALALEYNKLGANLALSDINVEGLNETVALCNAQNSNLKVHAQILDVSKKEDWKAYAEIVKSELGNADLIINNAGVTVVTNFDEMSEDEFEWVMNINFWGVVYGTRAFLDQIKASKGQIANVSSIFGYFVIPTQTSYHASKFAVRGFTESLSSELKLSDPDVGVTTIVPGGIRTNIVNNAIVGGDTDAEKLGTQKAFDKIAITKPKKAASIIANGLMKNKPNIAIGPDAKVLRFITRLFPTKYIGIAAKISDKQSKQYLEN